MGKKDLVENGKWTFRLGLHGAYLDNHIFYDYQGKTYQTRFQDTGGGLFVTWDWSAFCFIMRYNQGDKFQKLDVQEDRLLTLFLEFLCWEISPDILEKLRMMNSVKFLLETLHL